jgi:hypothetical protein
MCELNNQCPICFDTIGDKNNIITECGHYFHASCLMTNITHNGFGCPCCRALMATHSDDEDLSDDEDSVPSLVDYDSSESDDDDVSYVYESDDDNEENEHEDYVLRGLRLFTNLLENENHDDLDNYHEIQYNNTSVSQENESEIEIPSLDIITQLLKERGFSYKHLVANLLSQQKEYQKSVYYNVVSEDLHFEIDNIIHNYLSEQDSA